MCHVARNAKLRLAQLEQAHHNSVVTLNVKPNKARNRAKWERNFGLLSAYRAREGHADVPHSHEEKKEEEEEGVKLGSWLNTQRMAFKAGKLDQAQQKRLTSLGVTWNTFEARWGRNYCLLSVYRAREGHADVPHSHEQVGVKLGTWLNTQRMAFKAGELSQARQERLKMLGVEWNLFDATWERNFDVLLAYRAREGNADVPQSQKEEGAKLGGWLKNQRQAFKEGKWTGHIVSN
jgi:hypothetical protein